jgi:hypothetical protein
MTDFTPVEPDTAAGATSNVINVMANSPTLLTSYQALSRQSPPARFLLSFAPICSSPPPKSMRPSL